MAAEDWSAVTWEGARRAQLRDQARLTPAERLRWLEEALELARQGTGVARPTVLPYNASQGMGIIPKIS